MPAGGSPRPVWKGDYEWTVLDDPNLRGWDLPRIVVPKGSHISDIAVWATVMQEGPFKAKKLLVMFDVTWPDGFVDRQSTVTGEAMEWPLNDLRSLGKYIKQLAPSGDAELLSDQLCAELSYERKKIDEKLSAFPVKETEELPAQPTRQMKPGPKLFAQTILDFLELNELYRDVVEGEDVKMSSGEFNRMLDTIYRLGRAVREAEFSSDIARTQGLAASQRRTETAQAWWPAGAAWAQTLIKQFHEGLWRKGRRLSLNGLAQEMYDRWIDRNFEGGPDEFEPRYQYTDVLPKWRDNGWLSPTFPPQTRQEKTCST